MDYQTTKNNQHLLPDTVYRRVISIIRDYDRRKEQYDNLPTDDISIGIVSGITSSKVVDNTQRIGILRAEIAKEIDAVDNALSIVPPIYRDGVLQHILFPRSGYPENAHRNTYRYWKKVFVITVAESMNIL